MILLLRTAWYFPRHCVLLFWSFYLPPLRQILFSPAWRSDAWRNSLVFPEEKTWLEEKKRWWGRRREEEEEGKRRWMKYLSLSMHVHECQGCNVELSTYFWPCNVFFIWHIFKFVCIFIFFFKSFMHHSSFSFCKWMYLSSINVSVKTCVVKKKTKKKHKVGLNKLVCKWGEEETGDRNSWVRNEARQHGAL